MTPFPPSPSEESEAIDTAAAEWLCERDEGFTPARAQAFAAWRAADTRHEAAVQRTADSLALLKEMPVVRAPLEARLAARGGPVDATAGRKSWFARAQWAVGLAAAILIMTAGLWWLGSARPSAPQHFITASARQQQIELKDGSVMNLNISTEVQVRLEERERRVTVAAGEAHFAVAHDAARPFIVTAGGVSVRAIGTAFSVRVTDTGVVVLVNEGKVAVTREGAASAQVFEQPSLVAGQRATIRRDAPPGAATVEKISAESLSEAERWHSRVMTFTDLPLRDSIALFNRRNETQLVLADERSGDLKIGGTFAADQVESFVRLLEKDGDVVAERRGERLIALRVVP